MPQFYHETCCASDKRRKKNDALQVLLGRTVPPLLVHHVRTHNHNLHRDSSKQEREYARALLVDDYLELAHFSPEAGL